MLDRVSPPPFKKVQEFEIKQAVTEYLDNGLPLHIVEAGQQPLVKVEIIYRAGAWLEPKSGVAFFTTKMLGEGTAKRTGKKISQLVAQYGGVLEFHPGMDRVSIVLYTLTRHLPSLLPLLEEIIFKSIFPSEQLGTLQNIKKQDIKVENQMNHIVAFKHIRQLLFGSAHPYGRNLSEDDVDQIDSEMLNNYYQDTVLRKFEIFVSGDYNPDNFKWFNSYFGHFTRRERNPRSYFPTAADKDQILIRKENSLQSSIRLGRVLFKRNHPDYPSFLVLNELLGGFFGSRLMKNIREDKGFTYGISSNVVSLKQEGFFVIGTDVKKEHTSQTIDEIKKEIRRLREKNVGSEELETVKNYMVGSFLSEIANPFDVMDKYKAVYYDDLDYGYYDSLLRTLGEIDPPVIKGLANKYLDENDLLEVVVGDKTN